MSNDNETVAEIVKRVRRECNSLPLPNAAGEKLKLVREIDEAHKREIAAKDAEIARLTNIINTECNKCGDCAKFGNDCNAGDIDGNENCRACKKFVSKEVSALRELVKGLADVADCLNRYPAKCCYEERPDCNGCEEHEHCRFYKHNALVAKARKVIGGAK